MSAPERAVALCGMPQFGPNRAGPETETLAALFRGGPSDPASPAALDALARHPRFDAAVRLAAKGAIARYSGRRVANRILNDRGRVVFSVLLLDLALRGEAGGEPATVSRLREDLSAAGIASPNRVSAMVAAMRVLGLLTLGPGRDRRSRALVPTEALRAETRLRWEALTRGSALLFPELAAAAGALADPRVFAAVVHSLARRFREGYRVAAVVPPLEPYTERDGGLIILLALAMDEGFTIAATARRFHLSRAHVAKIVDAAVADGLATRGGARGGDIRPTAALGGVARRFVPPGLLAHALALEEAAALVSAPPDQRSPESASRSAAASSGAPASMPER